jgi:hypothetical protein
MTECATKNELIPITTADKATDITLFPLEQMIEMASKIQWTPTQSKIHTYMHNSHFTDPLFKQS